MFPLRGGGGGGVVRTRGTPARVIVTIITNNNDDNTNGRRNVARSPRVFYILGGARPRRRSTEIPRRTPRTVRAIRAFLIPSDRQKKKMSRSSSTCRRCVEKTEFVSVPYENKSSFTLCCCTSAHSFYPRVPPPPPHGLN